MENYGEFSYVIRYNVRYSKSHGELRTQIKRNSPIHGEKIKSDKLSHVYLLKDALENEIHGR
jgi:hypothetical protein